MQKYRELMGLNEHLTDTEITWAILYLDPDVHAGRAREDASRLVGICVTLVAGLTSAIAYICFYVRSL